VWHFMHQTLHEAVRGHDRLGRVIAGSSTIKTGRASRDIAANERPSKRPRH
jgi:hypothetical protein